SSFSFRPLGLTLVGYGLIAVIAVRRLRRSTPLTLTVFGLQAARLGIIHFGALLVVSVLSFAVGGREGHLNIISTLFFGTLTLVITLAIAWIVGLPGLLSPAVDNYRAKLAGPLKAVLALWLAASAAALVLILALVLTDSQRDVGPFA